MSSLKQKVQELVKVNVDKYDNYDFYLYSIFIIENRLNSFCLKTSKNIGIEAKMVYL